jgi:hypothetical protein
METAAYFFLGIIVITWIIAMLIGFVATFPVGLIGLPLIIGIGLLVIKVIKERLENDEDDYYSKNVNQ